MISTRLGAVFAVVAVFAGMSCIDLENPTMGVQDYKAEVRFVNFTDLGSATIKLDGDSFGSLEYGDASDYVEIDAGSRRLQVEFSEGDTSLDTDKSMVFATEKKGTVFILGDTSGVTYVNAEERYIFDGPPDLNSNWTHPDSAIVRIFSTLADFEEVDVSVTGDNSSFTEEGLSEGSASSYQRVYPGKYSVSVDTSEVSVFADSLTFDESRRYTVAVYGTLMKTFVDD